MSGTLEVRDVAVRQLKPGDSFDLLTEEMGLHYSFFEHKGIDWDALAVRYRARAGQAKDGREFAAVITDMLAELKDVHVTIRTNDGRIRPTHMRKWSGNFNFDHVARNLRAPQQIGKVGFVGRGESGFGYVAVGSLAGDEATFQEFQSAIVKLLDAPGLIIDLRANQGGDERRAQRIVGRFTDQRRVYAKSQYRSASAKSGFSRLYDRVLEPSGMSAYTKPIICLTGPGCISSGEGMALMLKSLPQATLIGQPTAGASGNPSPLVLPNGVTVSYSRWLSFSPDGQPLEGVGVAPQTVIEHQKRGDPTFEAAVRLINRRMKESRNE
jgi:C-terminal processing protease CtpA/Prc